MMGLGSERLQDDDQDSNLDELRPIIKPLLAKPRFSKWGYARGGGWERFKYSEFLRKDGMFPMTPFGGRAGQCLAHALTRGMGWGSCEPPELPHEALAVKAGGTGEAPHFSAG